MYYFLKLYGSDYAFTEASSFGINNIINLMIITNKNILYWNDKNSNSLEDDCCYNQFISKLYEFDITTNKNVDYLIKMFSEYYNELENINFHYNENYSNSMNLHEINYKIHFDNNIYNDKYDIKVMIPKQLDAIKALNGLNDVIQSPYLDENREFISYKILYQYIDIAYIMYKNDLYGEDYDYVKVKDILIKLYE